MVKKYTHLLVMCVALLLAFAFYYADHMSWIPHGGPIRNVRTWAPDALWTLSLMACMASLWLNTTPNRLLAVTSGALFVSLCYELLQGCGITPGTFSFHDITAISLTGIVFLSRLTEVKRDDD